MLYFSWCLGGKSGGRCPGLLSTATTRVLLFPLSCFCSITLAESFLTSLCLFPDLENWVMHTYATWLMGIWGRLMRYHLQGTFSSFSRGMIRIEKRYGSCTMKCIQPINILTNIDNFPLKIAWPSFRKDWVVWREMLEPPASSSLFSSSAYYSREWWTGNWAIAGSFAQIRSQQYHSPPHKHIVYLGHRICSGSWPLLDVYVIYPCRLYFLWVPRLWFHKEMSSLDCFFLMLTMSVEFSSLLSPGIS